MKRKNSILQSVVVLILNPMCIWVLLFSGVLFSCQQDSLPADDGILLKTAVIPEIVLDYPVEAEAGEEFSILFSSGCGKIMLERGYTDGEPILDNGIIVGYEKVYQDLDCETEQLNWEPVGSGDFLSCAGATVREVWENPGTYVYRIKLNQKAYRGTGCPDAQSFRGNLFQCFMVTVVDSGTGPLTGTFEDSRDGKVYKWVNLGAQTWMAENLAWLPAVSPPAEGSNTAPYYYVLNYEGNSVAEAKATQEYSKYGVFYNWPAAMGYQAGTQGSLNMFVQGACPDGWHLPSQQEWQDLLNYLADNGYGFNEIVDDVAKSLAAKTDWASSSHPASPGYNPDTNNQSGFTGLPAGNVWFDRDYPGKFDSFSYNCRWWSSKSLGADWSVIANLYVQYTGLVIEPFEVKSGVCVRCLKN